MKQYMKFAALSVLVLAALPAVNAQPVQDENAWSTEGEEAWQPGDFGNSTNLWEGSPHLERNLANPTDVWTALVWPPTNEMLESTDVPRTTDGLPDIFREWDFEWARIGPQQADGERHLSAEEGHRILREDFASERRFKEWETRSLVDIPTNNCVPHHSPRMAVRASNLEIVRSGDNALIDKVIFLHEQFNVIRKAYISLHPEPDLAARPTWGTANGEWIDRSGDGEVDTLVVVTRGMVGSWVDQTGVTYETGTVLTEEYWLNEDGTKMYQHIIIEDPKTYAHPIHHTQNFQVWPTAEEAVYDEYVCNLESARPDLIMQRYGLSGGTGNTPPAQPSSNDPQYNN